VGGCHSSIAEQQVFKPRGREGVNGYSPLVIRTTVRGANSRFKVVKVVLRVAYVDGRIVERDVVGAINIGLKYLSSNGSPMALGLDRGP
jgi:putative transposase